MSTPYAYQIFTFWAICFLVGVGVGNIYLPDKIIIFWIVVGLFGLAGLFIRDRWVWSVAIIAAAFFIGWAYPLLLGREKLILLDQRLILFQILKNLRFQFESILNQLLPYPQSSLASGLLIGVGADFPKKLKEAFIATGTIHIVAISGFNITLVIRIFADWVRGWGRTVAFASGSLMILLFVILVGGQASVVRAGIMGWLFLLARFVYRQPAIINILLFSALLMVLEEPKILAGVGFQLSFGAMLGLIYISPLMREGFRRLAFLGWLPTIFQSVLIETLAAQIMVAPLIMFHFGRVSPLSPIPNFLILPFIIFPMGLGFFSALFGSIWFVLGKIIASPLAYFLNYFIWAVKMSLKIPGMNLAMNLSWQGLFLSYLFLAVLIFLLYRFWLPEGESFQE